MRPPADQPKSPARDRVVRHSDEDEGTELPSLDEREDGEPNTKRRPPKEIRHG